jgi:hypothetical protein
MNKREHYGLLRYMNHELGSKLEAVEDWTQSLGFNCLGEIDPQSRPDDQFSLSTEGMQALLEFTEQRQDCDRGLRFFVLQGKLHIQVLFRTGAFSSENMQDLLEKTRDSFLEICRIADLPMSIAAVRG